MSHYGPVIHSVTLHIQKFTKRLRFVGLRCNLAIPLRKRSINSRMRKIGLSLSRLKLSATLNVIYADTDGNLDYYYAGKVPIRQWLVRRVVRIY